MKHFLKAFSVGAFAVAMAVGSGSAGAQSLTPTYDSFANLSVAELAVINFNGSGISDYGPVAVTNFASLATPTSGTPVRLALAATPRVSGAYTGPAVTNDGLGTYFAQPGESPATGSNNAPWNIDYAIVGDTRGLTFQMFFDVAPGVGTPANQYLNFSGLLGSGVAGSSVQSTQDSTNLGFFDGGSTYPFNPYLPGEYMLSLRAFNGATLVDEVAIRVSVVPEPEAYGLAFAGLGVVAFAMRRRRNASA